VVGSVYDDLASHGEDARPTFFNEVHYSPSTSPTERSRDTAIALPKCLAKHSAGES